MATNDWKAELKRRIKDIRDRKEQEQEVERRTKDYKKSHVKKGQTVPFPSQPATETEVKAVEAASETVPEERLNEPQNESIAVEATPDNKPEQETDIEATSEPAEEIDSVIENSEPESPVDDIVEEPAEPPLNSSDQEDAIFQMEDSEEEPAAVSRDEAAIRAELARMSGGKKKSKAKKNEPTLFPVDEGTGSEDASLRLKTPVMPDDFKGLTAPEAKHALDKKKKDSSEVESAPAQSSNLNSLDDAIDQYIPVDSSVSEYDADSSVKPRQPSATVVDKTIRNMCLKRIGAAIIDIILMLAVLGAVLWISAMIVQSSPLNLILDSPIPFSAFTIALHLLYYVIFTSTTGQTLGKAALRLRVVSTSQSAIGLWPAALRWLIGLVGTAFVLLGYLIMFMTREGAAIQDIALHQRVRRMKKPEILKKTKENS